MAINPVAPQQSPLLNVLNAANSVMGIREALRKSSAEDDAAQGVVNPLQLASLAKDGNLKVVPEKGDNTFEFQVKDENGDLNPVHLAPIADSKKALDLMKTQLDITKLNQEINTPKQNQSTAATFAIRANQANENLAKLYGNGYDPTTTNAGIQSSSLFPGFMMGQENRAEDQAKRSFVNAMLRRESGAAISSSEFADAKSRYFPVAGDSPEVIAQKEQNRIADVASLKSEAGPALGQVLKQFNTDTASNNKTGAIGNYAKTAGQLAGGGSGPPSGGGIGLGKNAHAGDAGTGPHGNVVQQNGVTYNWNPSTKKYEAK